MQLLAGMSIDGAIYTDVDVNGDGVIGMAEQIYILLKVAGLR